jgi:hypothetical protein
MSANIDKHCKNKKHKRFKEACQYENCIRRATVQISINVGEDRIVRIKLCKKCIKFFKDDQIKAHINNPLTSDESFSRETDPNSLFIMEGIDWKFPKGCWCI